MEKWPFSSRPFLKPTPISSRSLLMIPVPSVTPTRVGS